MKYDVRFIDKYIINLNTTQGAISLQEWLNSQNLDKDSNFGYYERIQEKLKEIHKNITIKEFLNFKGYTNIERLKDFPDLVDLLSKVFYDGQLLGENKVYNSMNLKEPNQLFYNNFEDFMKISSDVKDSILKLLYFKEIEKL